ncbi:MAG: hypothetical protein PHH84_08405 [Oscillospiraceae bacterium]|nr:hypothetical protein [Oscillospiraceae bacterium]MDD4414635.1 hypothetical protein [Oscillospiraceae bacterium]
MIQAKTQHTKSIYKVPQIDIVQLELNQILSTSSVFEGEVDGGLLF